MDVSVNDYVLLAAFAVFLLVLAFVKTRTFLLVDAVCSLSLCLFLMLQPTFFENQINRWFDNFHILLERGICCFAITNSIYFLAYVRNAKEEDAANGLIACRTLGSGFLTLVTAVGQWKFAGLYKEKAYLGFLINGVLWTVMCAYHLYWRGILRPKQGRSSPVDLYIKIDVVLMLLMSIPDLLFPSYTRNFLSIPIDFLHQHMITVSACLNFTNAIFGVYALGFRNIAERKGYLYCRITVQLLLLAISLWTIYRGIKLTTMDIALYLLGFIPVIPALAGIYMTSNPTVAKRVGYNLRTRSR